MNQNNISLAITLALTLLEKAAAVSAAARQAESEGRDLSIDELRALQAQDNAAADALDEAILRAESEGR